MNKRSDRSDKRNMSDSLSKKERRRKSRINLSSREKKILMRSPETSSNNSARMKLLNFVKKRTSEKEIANMSARRRSSTRSAKNRDKRMRKRRKSRKLRQISYEDNSCRSSKIWMTMSLIEMLVVQGQSMRRISFKLSKIGAVRKKRPRKRKMIASEPMIDTRGSVKIETKP